MDMDRTLKIQQAKYEKAAAISKQMYDAVRAIYEHYRILPRTGKKGRNIFKKSYNRRPRNRQKRAAVMGSMAVCVASNALQVSRIISTPIPKNPEGGKTFDERGPEIVINVDGIPYEVKQALKMKEGSFIDLESKIKKHLE